MKPTVLTPPDGAPVSLSAVKDYLRIGHDGEDALVEALIGSATTRLESELGHALVQRTLRLALYEWPIGFSGRGIRLHPGPVTELGDVFRVTADAARETLSARFMLKGDRLCLKPSSMCPAIAKGERIEVVFEAGYGTPDSVPSDLTLAVKMLAAQGYLLRNGGADAAEDALPAEIDNLLAPYKGVRL